MVTTGGNVNTALKNFLSSELLTIATCWKLKLLDGTVMGFTDSDKDLNIDGIIYKSSTGFTASSIILNSDIKPDNLEIEGVLNSDEIKEQDILLGRYDFANIETFIVNYNDVNQGIVNLHRGVFGKITLNNGKFIAEISGLTTKLSVNITEMYSPTCRAKFCDNRCKVDAGKFTVTSCITGIIGEKDFEDVCLNANDGYYKHGIVKFIDMPMQTVEFVVKNHRNKIVTLFTALPCGISVGSKYSILAGCDKAFLTCKNKFNNVTNFRGEPHVQLGIMNVGNNY